MIQSFKKIESERMLIDIDDKDLLHYTFEILICQQQF